MFSYSTDVYRALTTCQNCCFQVIRVVTTVNSHGSSCPHSLDQTDCLLITLLLKSLVFCFCFFKSLPLIFLIENSRKYPILSASSLLSYMPIDSDISFSKIHTKSDCSETHPDLRYIFNIHKAFKGVDVFIIKQGQCT